MAVGHPGELWTELQGDVQDRGVTRFTDIEGQWLSLMWSIDAYRAANVAPRLMGREDIDLGLRLGAIYRSKGNWFATLISLLLQNRTHEPILPRVKVRGFSQWHQLDVAWPVRDEDPLVCVATKVTGAPPQGEGHARGAISDFTNRRKEVKFAATDLKLNRGQQETTISSWGAWRDVAPPRTFFLWAARLRTETRKPDLIERLVDEAAALRDSYVDGTGLVAWRPRSDGTSYEVVPLPLDPRVARLDEALDRIASEIGNLIGPNGRVPDPVRPPLRTVAVDRLTMERAR